MRSNWHNAKYYTYLIKDVESNILLYLKFMILAQWWEM